MKLFFYFKFEIASLHKRKRDLSMLIEEISMEMKEYDKLIEEEFEEENLFKEFESESDIKILIIL